MINYEELINSYNKQAMIALKSDQIPVSLNFLNQSKLILEKKSLKNFNKLCSLTYNNYGCFYKRTGDLNSALKYFNESLAKAKAEKKSFDRNI